jgi:AcrR family transcriptional regulator
MMGAMGLPEYETRPQGDPETVVRALLDRPPVAIRLLEAARGCVLDRGISRVTMSDVARRADVSRTTLYRHYPDVETVLRDLMTLDFGRAVLGASRKVLERPTERERLAGTLVEGCRAMRADDLFRKILDVDPEFLLPYVTARTGVSQRVVLTLLEAGVRRGQTEDGSIRDGDPVALAGLLLLQAHALTVSLGIVADDEEGERATLALADEAFEAQLRPTPGS